MAKNNVADLDTTAANNTDFAGTDSTGTTGLVKNGDNILRTIGAMLKKWWNDLGGTATVGGTANAITLTSASTYQSLVSGIRILFKPSADNSGATTLNLDGLGAKAVRKIASGTDAALSGAEILNGQRAEIVYDSSANSSAGAWILLNPGGGSFLSTSGGTLTGNLSINKTGGSSTAFGGSGDCGVEIGRTDGSSGAAFVDFHSGATAVDYDARIYASGGTGSNGGGTLTVTAKTLEVVAALNFAPTATIASATTTDIGAAASNSVIISGATTITGLGTVAAGVTREVLFSGALTLTYDGTALILPGTANIVTAANDTAAFRSLGSGNWVCLWYKRADGTPIGASGSMTLLGTLTTTSGTTQSLTGIAAGYRQFYIEIEGVSNNSSSATTLQLLLGSGSTSYGAAGSVSASLSSGTAVLAGFIIVGNISSTTAAAKSALASVMIDGASGTATNVSTPTGTAAVTTAVRFSWSSGASFDAGTIRVYGVK